MSHPVPCNPALYAMDHQTLFSVGTELPPHLNPLHIKEPICELLGTPEIEGPSRKCLSLQHIALLSLTNSRQRYFHLFGIRSNPPLVMLQHDRDERLLQVLINPLGLGIPVQLPFEPPMEPSLPDIHSPEGIAPGIDSGAHPGEMFPTIDAGIKGPKKIESVRHRTPRLSPLVIGLHFTCVEAGMGVHGVFNVHLI